MRYRKKYHPRVLNKGITQKVKATDVLYKEMLFWSDEGKKLVAAVYHLVSNQDGKLAAKLMNTFKDVNDRAVEVATRLAPYQTPKLSSIEVASKKTIKFVIEAPKLAPNLGTWLNQVSRDQALLPKPKEIINGRSHSDDDDIEDIEAIDHE